MRIRLRNLSGVILLLVASSARYVLSQDEDSFEESSEESVSLGAENESNVPDESVAQEKLTVDNTLTIRILKSTSSKKTILINRGTDDGLDMGMHARFFNEGGTVARGILVDKKDDRSIWSIYRQVSPDLLETDQVMSIKITPEVKITNDETKSVLREGLDQKLLPDRLAPNRIPLDQVQGDLPTDLASSGVAESNLSDFNAKDLDLTKKSIEIYFKGFLLAQTSEATSSDGATFTGSSYAGSVSLGIEKYFTRSDSWLKRFSITPYGHFGAQKLLSYEGTQTDSQFYEAGIGLNFYFLDAPHLADTLHPYLSFASTYGVVQDQFSSGQRDANRDAASLSKVSGKTSSVSGGVGVKYFTTRGWSFSFSTEIVRRIDLFDGDPDTSNALWDRIVLGPRVSFGMGLRF
ncbi:MAG: hypothetical protein QE271_03425 [Bacteriovoracaceae bacterium]|nr:hypothetical protein [Bacteriovoracaceae bacterium]